MSSGDFSGVNNMSGAGDAFFQAFMAKFPNMAKFPKGARAKVLKELERSTDSVQNMIIVQIIDVAAKAFAMNEGIGLENLGGALDALGVKIQEFRKDPNRYRPNREGKLVDTHAEAARSAEEVIEQMREVLLPTQHKHAAPSSRPDLLDNLIATQPQVASSVEEVIDKGLKAIAPAAAVSLIPDLIHNHPALPLLKKWVEQNPYDATTRNRRKRFQHVAPDGTGFYKGVIGRVRDGVVIQSLNSWNNYKHDGSYFELDPDGNLIIPEGVPSRQLMNDLQDAFDVLKKLGYS